MAFFTIGLPRSRSLWLSKVLGYKKMVLHEALSGHGWTDIPYADGFCDTNPLTAPKYGKNPVLVVHRPVADIVRSALQKFDCPEGVQNYEHFLYNYLDHYKQALDALEIQNREDVNAHDLSDPDVVSSVCAFLGVDVPAQHIREMCRVRVETTNRDLTESLKHTAAAEGEDYRRYIARFDRPTYAITRTFDVGLAASVMGEMWDEVAEDDAPPYTPDVVNEIWLCVYSQDEFVGMVRLHAHTSVMWEGHIFILPQKRKHSKWVGGAIKGWIKDNLPGAKRIIANVPERFQNVVGFLKNNGFEEQGFSPSSYTKNGIVGIHQLGMNTEEM